MQINIPIIRKYIIGATLIIISLDLFGIPILSFIGLSLDTVIFSIITIKVLLAIILLYATLEIGRDRKI